MRSSRLLLEGTGLRTPCLCVVFQESKMYSSTLHCKQAEECYGCMETLWVGEDLQHCQKISAKVVELTFLGLAECHEGVHEVVREMVWVLAVALCVDWAREKGKTDKELVEEMRKADREKAVCSSGKEYAKKPVGYKAACALPREQGAASHRLMEEETFVPMKQVRRRSPSPSKGEQDFRRNAPSAEHQARMQQLFEKYGMAKGSEGGRTGHDIDGPEMMRFGQNLNLHNYNYHQNMRPFSKILGYVHGQCWFNIRGTKGMRNDHPQV
ncbi:unnamed protein product [Cladocopium goreaui]|uniref:Tudor domain-containing protein n=1 Tax=Cladocopium goreaui TaxID=2562237 RepID=A0A9P1DQX0_9DINO|nr:unnamed protein product [Cladocopium goreaui]